MPRSLKKGPFVDEHLANEHFFTQECWIELNHETLLLAERDEAGGESGTEEHQRHAGCFPHSRAMRRDLLYKNDNGEHAHPHQIHRAYHKQDNH